MASLTRDPTPSSARLYLGAQILLAAGWLAYMMVVLAHGMWAWKPPTIIPSCVGTAHLLSGGVNAFSPAPNGTTLLLAGLASWTFPLWLFPVVWLGGSPLAIANTELVFQALGSVLFFVYARRKLGNPKTALLISAAFLLQPLVVRAYVMDIYAPVMLLVAGAMLAREARRWVLFSVLVVLLAASHQFGPVYAIGICLLAAQDCEQPWKRRLRRLAAFYVAFFGALGVVVIALKLGGRLDQALHRPVWVHPTFYPQSALLLTYLLVSLAFLPIRRWQWMLITVPSIVYAVFSRPWRMHGDYLMLVAFWFVAAVEGLALKPRWRLAWVGPLIAVATVAGLIIPVTREVAEVFPDRGLHLTQAEQALAYVLQHHPLPEECATQRPLFHLLGADMRRRIVDVDDPARRPAPCVLLRTGGGDSSGGGWARVRARLARGELQPIFDQAGMLLAVEPSHPPGQK